MIVFAHLWLEANDGDIYNNIDIRKQEGKTSEDSLENVFILVEVVRGN